MGNKDPETQILRLRAEGAALRMTSGGDIRIRAKAVASSFRFRPFGSGKGNGNGPWIGIEHPASSITAVQNRSPPEVSQLKHVVYGLVFGISGSRLARTRFRSRSRIAAAAIRSPGDEVASSGWFNRRNSRCGVGVSPAHRAAETAAPQRPEPEEVNAVRCPGR